MGASHSRKEWLRFKKAFPAFEKSKNYKLDLGPDLDNFEKAVLAWGKAEGQLAKAMAASFATMDKIVKTLSQYESVVAGLNDAKAKAAFENFAKVLRTDAQRLGEIERVRQRYILMLQALAE